MLPFFLKPFSGSSFSLDQNPSLGFSRTQSSVFCLPSILWNPTLCPSQSCVILSHALLLVPLASVWAAALSSYHLSGKHLPRQFSFTSSREFCQHLLYPHLHQENLCSPLCRLLQCSTLFIGLSSCGIPGWGQGKAFVLFRQTCFIISGCNRVTLTKILEHFQSKFHLHTMGI